MTRKNFRTLAVTMLITVSTASVRAAARAPITSTQVASALAFSGLHVDANQIELLSPVDASESNPRLSSAGVEPLDQNTAKVRMQCTHTKVCLPFYVLIHWADANQPEKLQNAAITRHIILEDLMVHNGKDATMIFDGPNLKMSMPVLCLQNGVRGQHIRVVSKDHKKIFLARVIGPGIVTSTVVN